MDQKIEVISWGVLIDSLARRLFKLTHLPWEMLKFCFGFFVEVFQKDLF